MSRSIRFLMGVVVVSILAPAMAMVMPVGGDERAVPALAQASADIVRDPTPSQSPQQDPPTTQETPAAEEFTTSFGETNSQGEEGAERVETDHSGNSDHSNRPDDHAKAEPERSSTTADTSHPDTTTTSTTGATSGVISGAACPCTITSTAELKGQISLQGDLVVDGGSLVARPGVDLDGNGFQIMFMNGGRADFQGTKVFTWSDRGAKQNLQRDINFRNLRRIMWMANGGSSILKYFTVSDSGTSNLGDYPLHWHLNGNSTRGTIVEGVVVINGKHHAYVPHGSHGITFRDVIAKNTTGDAFWWDPPGTNDCSGRDRFCTADNSNDIVFDRALADGVRNGPGDDRGFRLSAFMLGAGSGNVVRNSSAINIAPTHVRSCSGFHWPEGVGSNVGGNVWTFRNNSSSSGSGCHGIFVWQNSSNNHVIDGFSGSGIEHGAYGNEYEYRNINVPYVEVHAAGWSVIGGRIGTVITSKHRKDTSPTVLFQDVNIDQFIIRNAGDNGDIPGHYVLNNTGLACEDIEYGAVVPGTRVVIDGEEC